VRFVLDIATFLGIISAFSRLGIAIMSRGYFNIFFYLPFLEEGKGARSLTDPGSLGNPARLLINLMKSGGINKKLMDDFLTHSQIKDMEIRDCERELPIILPEVVGFVPGKNQLTDQVMRFLDTMLILTDELMSSGGEP
jgi:hypothetical protein